MSAARCKSCGAEIFWTVTKRGRRMPMDREPDPAGNFTVSALADIPDEYTAHGVTETTPAGATRYTSHFATCPNASRHRKQPNASG